MITDKQIESAIAEHGSQAKAAAALGLNRRTVDRRVRGWVKRGYAPEYDLTRPVPDGFRLKGASTFYDEHGVKRMQWVKSQIDPERMAELQHAALEAMAARLPRVRPQPFRSVADADLATCYVLTDYHLGMLAWREESGDDWDVPIASDLLVRWFRSAIDNSPAAGVGILAQLGDFLHWDGLEAVTPTSRHVLDADTRFQKVVRVAIQAMRQIVQMMLDKHQTVHIINAEGNHDPASSIWLREMLAVIYEREPRVTVEQSPDPFYCYQHGDVALFFHHGHKVRPGQLDVTMAAKFSDVFGRTRHRFAHCGHLHHKQMRESALMLVEQHRTLAAKDAYASRGGWLSGRSASAITYHARYGEISRVTLPPEAVV
ncbi:helix-turn-helix domain-containing protein [Nguyenibacter vanlangensis]|uniref:Helix-turn-helix domain-containing protein n=1 Tax=Nguyenibacter vanlangensis TaxID=1216886 RepID=A0ABZ3D1N0_9PROT